MTMIEPEIPAGERQQAKGGPHAGKFDYIDAVRGWAILLVITSHVGGRFAELPYPVKKLTNFGVHGVQMFFLASAVTLMLSWYRQHRSETQAVRNFFLRRFLRISPMYYAGALLYFLCDPPTGGFSLAQLLRAFAFVNIWHPTWIPVTPGWMVVPGGWSIGVEFTFYALFPLLATLLPTLRRALVCAAVAFAAALIANRLGTDWLTQDYSAREVRNFIYFWFPNQAPIFALGIVLYHLLSKDRARHLSSAKAYSVIAGIFGVCVAAAEFPSVYNSFLTLTEIPTLYIASLAFMIFVLVLARNGDTLFSHKLIRHIGRLSFSAYVLHFLFVGHLPDWSGGWIDIQATGFAAIGMAFVLWMAVMICTVLTSQITHRIIEKPGIALARRLIDGRFLRPA